ncbi:MAG TPA: alpha/beta fold hydrolase [Bryobacteraceae bacterium]|jgi:enterochelin esterase-like enzyme
MKRTLVVRLTLTLVVVLSVAAFLYAQAPAAGTVEHIKVHAKSLEVNLLGDSPDRDVFVYLPPSYQANKNQRYPVVYLLHGYGLTAERWVPFLGMPELADKDIAAGTSKEMILVSPDSFNKYNGAMYSSSPTNGDWETFLSKELVAYVDKNYRTIATRDSRGLAGHSMGGYGTWRLAMKYPEVWSSIYAMSSCCLMNGTPPAARGGGTPGAAKGPAPAAAPPAAAAAANGKQDDGKGKGGAKGGRGGGFGNTAFAEAAAWSPNPAKALFFDQLNEDGKYNAMVGAKWMANSPLVMANFYVANLKKFKAVAMDVGLQDTLYGSNRDMDALLTSLGIAHTYETYEGDHTNHVKDRFEQKVLPFFTAHLTFSAAKR